MLRHQHQYCVVMAVSESARQVIEELYRSARRNYQRRKVIMYGVNDTYQIDLVEMIPYAKQNKNFKYILTIIDIFSKYSWAITVKTKSSKDVTRAMCKIIESGNVPKNIQSDKGKEFYNSDFKQLMNRHNINLYSSHSILKASIVERFNRTLKTKMWKQLHLNGSYKWIDILPELIDTYNNTKHSTIRMTPKRAHTGNKKIEQHLLNTVYNYKINLKLPKFQAGDHVRVSKQKHLFEKGYTANWTGEIFKIDKVMQTSPITYLLKDYQGADIAGAFYEEELQLVKYPEVYLIEKILKRQGSRIYVKWLGFDSSHNSWISNDNQL